VSPKLKHGRGAASNDPGRLGRLTPRAQARRRHDLIRTFLAALGGADAVSPVAMMQVKKAAELLALAEALRASMIGDPTRDVTGLVRLEGEARRTLRSLGIKTDTPPPPVVRFSPMKAVREHSEAVKAAKKAAKAAIRKEARLGVTAKGPPNEHATD
jgi:hypothetical protein